MTLEAGSPAPDFTLPTHDGASFTLSEQLGKSIVLYFYPKDDTPGCTAQSCEYNTLLPDFDAQNAMIVGISRDNAASHERFRAKYGLNFALLVDDDHAVHELYGAWGEKTLYGRTSVGVLRSSVVIDAEGNIVTAAHKVRAKGNAQRMLDLLG